MIFWHQNPRLVPSRTKIMQGNPVQIWQDLDKTNTGMFRFWGASLMLQEIK